MNAFERRIRTIIEAEGPLPLSRYMALCLSDPRHGYYTTRDPLGAAGDFTTAPEISQMFGELIGLWCVEVWRAMDAVRGTPQSLHLVELGPGRGTLMKDLLRAAKIVPVARSRLVIVGPVSSPPTVAPPSPICTNRSIPETASPPVAEICTCCPGMLGKSVCMPARMLAAFTVTAPTHAKTQARVQSWSDCLFMRPHPGLNTTFVAGLRC